MRRVAGVASLLMTIATAGVQAQARPQSAAVQAPRDTTSTPTTRWQFDQCMGGLTYGAPLKWALSYGMGFVRESDTIDLCFLGAAKIGFGGASFNVGLANSVGHFGSGGAVTVGLLRTFNDPLYAIAKRTYVGASVHVWPLFGLGGDIGYYTRTGTDAPGTRSGRGIVTWSAGFGF
jgi:hypothetical protein